MINKEILLRLIEDAIVESDNYVSKYYHRNEEPMQGIKKALEILRSEVENNPQKINERVLRAMYDISGLAVKMFEESDLEERILDVTRYLRNHISIYKDLEPLRMGFGKQEPI